VGPIASKVVDRSQAAKGEVLIAALLDLNRQRNAWHYAFEPPLERSRPLLVGGFWVDIDDRHSCRSNDILESKCRKSSQSDFEKGRINAVD
jgi:hypothetical protein